MNSGKRWLLSMPETTLKNIVNFYNIMRTIMKTSKITQITKTKVRDWPNWRLYYISLKLENGENITLWKKKEDAFKIGQEIKYEEIEKGKKWKEIKENWFKASNPKKDIVLTAFQVAFSKALHIFLFFYFFSQIHFLVFQECCNMIEFPEFFDLETKFLILLRRLI